MTRTGERTTWRLARALALTLTLTSAVGVADEPEFHQTVDRTTVGTEDTFRLTIVAPDGGDVSIPLSDDVETVQQSQMTEMSYQLGPSGSVIRNVRKYIFVLRARRPGTLVLPGAELVQRGRTLRAKPITIEVKQGRLQDPGGGGGRLPDPFSGSPFQRLEELEEELGFPTPAIPRGDSDLFVRSMLSKDEAYVGEQVTLSVYIFSRVDLSSVESVIMPKLDGFWSEDVDSPTQLSGEQRVIGGVVYRSYLLKRRALFPVRPGTIAIPPAEADITTGFMLFRGHRVHRKGNALELKVRPLPAGAPADFVAGNVGRWTLRSEASQTKVGLGDPVTVRLRLEGTGNLKNVTVPPLSAPTSLKVYEPTTTDRVTVGKGLLGGERVLEYLVAPQATGQFTIPSVALTTFDPGTRRYQTSRTEPLRLTVVGGGGRSGPVANAEGESNGAKNKLEAGGVRPLRHRATLRATSPSPVYRAWFFIPVLLTPLAFLGGLAAVVVVRRSLSRRDPSAIKRRQARLARARLAGAERLKGERDAAAFYAEVERALQAFLEAKLGAPVGGLTREQLDRALEEAKVDERGRGHIRAVLETCEHGRFAPGSTGDRAREQVLDAAVAAMESFGPR